MHKHTHTAVGRDGTPQSVYSLDHPAQITIAIKRESFFLSEKNAKLSPGMKIFRGKRDDYGRSGDCQLDEEAKLCGREETEMSVSAGVGMG